MIENDSFSLYKGDCIEIMKSIPSNSIDMVLTDPPYGTTACKWDSIIDLNKMWNELERITKVNGSKILFAQQPFTSLLVVSNIKQYRHKWNWVKDQSANFIVAKSQPLKYCEEIIVFNSNGYIQHKGAKKHCATYNPQFRSGKGPKKKPKIKARKGSLLELNHRDNPSPVISYETSHLRRYPKDNIHFPIVKRGRLHPTQKPIPLLSYLIKTYSLENETVLDFTMGSGSTGVACLNNNRKFIGIEKDDYYFEVSKKRIVRFKFRLEKSKKDE